MTVRDLVLASTSPYRLRLLERLRLPFETAAPAFEEIAPPPGPVTAEQVRALVSANARGKAASLRGAHPGSLILASDQLGECEGRALTKPGSEEAAVGQLLWLRGRKHRLHTAVALLDARNGRLEEAVVTSPLRMRHLPEDRLRRYVALERPLRSAGSYHSEGLGIVLFETMGGDDPTAIVGLPLIAVTRLLAAFGLDPLEER
jgi:septum formation protein